MHFLPGRATDFRDMSLYPIGNGTLLVTACDAAGGIGEKGEDIEPAPPESVGYFCARVTMLELLTLGATICSVSCTFSVEREPTGRRLLAGVRKQLREESLDGRIAFTISSENNFPSVQTGIGVTMSGLVGERDVPWDAVHPGDRLLVLGSRLVGRHVRVGHPAMVRVPTVRSLVKCDEVREVIPVGSGGVAGELAQLAARGIRIDTSSHADTADWSGSGGPATAVLVIAASDFDLPAAAAHLQPDVPIQWIGQVTDISKRAGR
ncbi:hypothetical protein ITP53_06145 [Nonomuraea sp. K274]|uniref:Uncharacterized protein n=1 Tax=Nonomuraea cypriaca TaxID=1187855 RepID=A0A931A556_9ACTN|nr:hypothetical protein [Nonomuraea cypriaca]MBF8185323.1 hypothetical protein [Nonomuraea cypriaca]